MMKAKCIFPFIAAAMAVMALASCSIQISKREVSDKVTTKAFDATGFDKLTLSCYADVVYTVSDTVNISVTTSEETMQDLEIKTTEDGHLTIGLANHSNNSFFLNTHSPDLTVNISGPSLQEILITGSGTFECDDMMTIETMRMNVSGSGEIKLKGVNAKTTSCGIIGSGDVNIDGIECEELNVSISGSGDTAIHANNVGIINAGVVGSGDIVLDCKDCGTAKVAISGSGDISMCGNVKQLDKNVTGSGEIDTRRLKVEN